ncbi:hypothetical protein [Streptomyces phytophilus]|uniref:hypothetical protein n=1 Tax=Streptomyces phytophilus TaxID=722715 RepID=UPI0015F0117E|nr:hypothetical protein [Streptomyces phytophilus]
MTGSNDRSLTNADLDTAISMLGKQAANYSRTGPKRKEDDTHTAINSLLDMRDERKED